MSKFEIGDRVRVIDTVLHPTVEKNRPFYTKFEGLEGKIINTWHTRAGYTFPYEVKLDRADTQFFCEKELEKIEVQCW